MSAFTHGFNHGFLNGMLNQMFGGFSMFNWGCWNSAPTFFTPNYSFGNIFPYQTPLSNMPSVFNYNIPNFMLNNTLPTWQNYDNISSNFPNNIEFGDNFVRTNTYLNKVKFEEKAKPELTGNEEKGLKNYKYHAQISTVGNNKYNSLILKYAKNYDIDPNLIKAIIRQESQFNPNAESRIKKNNKWVSGAQGLMQLMPDTAKQQGVNNPFDPEENIKGGVKYFKSLLDRYNGNVEKALAAYNWGLGNLDKKGLNEAPKETKEFIPKVLGYYKEYQNV